MRFTDIVTTTLVVLQVFLPAVFTPVAPSQRALAGFRDYLETAPPLTVNWGESHNIDGYLSTLKEQIGVNRRVFYLKFAVIPYDYALGLSNCYNEVWLTLDYKAGGRLEGSPAAIISLAHELEHVAQDGAYRELEDGARQYGICVTAPTDDGQGAVEALRELQALDDVAELAEALDAAATYALVSSLRSKYLVYERQAGRSITEYLTAEELENFDLWIDAVPTEANWYYGVVADAILRATPAGATDVAGRPVSIPHLSAFIGSVQK